MLTIVASTRSMISATRIVASTIHRHRYGVPRAAVVESDVLLVLVPGVLPGVALGELSSVVLIVGPLRIGEQCSLTNTVLLPNGVRVKYSVRMTQHPWQPISPAKPARAAKEPLNRERIVDAAMRVLVSNGYDAVSMRKVAQELGTGPASLYAHVANKRELDQLLVERAASQMDFDEAVDPERWQEQLKSMMREMLRVLRANPGVARASIGQVPLGERALRSTERILALLKAGNIPDQAAAWAVYLHGSAGNRLTRRIGALGFLARELCDEIAPIMNALAGKRPD